MMGYPTHFGQMECLKLIASSKFPEKRVGYLGLTQLLDENTEVLMLVTNSIKNDMNHDNQYVAGLALCAFGNIASVEMCQALSTEIGNLLKSSNPYVRKKAALCAMRIVKKVEDIQSKFNNQIPGLLEDRNHGVMVSGCALLTALLDLDKEYIPEFRKQSQTLIRSLRNMVTSGYTNAAEYDIAGIIDPFLQAKILRLLKILGQNSLETSEGMNDILAQVATNTEGTKNTGNAILYECVLTIMAIEETSQSGLRVLGINILGRFLLSRDNNIRYVALATLQKVVSIDLKAVQRHRGTIIDCLKDPDISIRKRALDVTYALVNEDNIKNMTKELLNYLLVSDNEFKEDLCMRICHVVERYAPSRRWQIDTLIKVMCAAGNFVQEESREKFCSVIAASPQLHSYTVIKLYFNMKESLTQEALVHVGVWCIGEFGDHLVSGRAMGPDQQPIHVSPTDVLDLLAEVVRKPAKPQRAHLTHSLVASALVKLVTRCPTEFDRIRATLKKFETSISVDLQQRTCEFLELLKSPWDSARSGILDRMPVSETGWDNGREVGDTKMEEVPRGSSVPFPAASASLGHGTKDLLDLDDDAPPHAAAPLPPAAVLASSANSSAVVAAVSVAPAPAAMAGGGADLLDLDLSGASPSSVAVSSSPTNQQAANGDLGMLDLLLGAETAAPTTPTSAAAAQPTPVVISQTVASSSLAAAREFPPMQAFKSGDTGSLKVMFHCVREDDGSNGVTAVYHNTGPQQITEFLCEAAVPKYLRLNMKPASGSCLEPSSSNVTQRFTVENTTGGEKPLLMKLRINYKQNGNAVQETSQVANFPVGF